MMFRNNLLLFVLFFITNGAFTQDTMRYRHHFTLPTGENQLGYEKKIAQYPSNIHSFIFQVPDSCTVYIVIRSENDSLDIHLGNEVIDAASKQDEQYVYSLVKKLPRGENIFVIRTRKYCSYSVYVKGQL
jgi:hypothetical protein